jgi:hypothetical protein
MDDALVPAFAPPVRRPSALRRLIGLGIGAVLALGYWGLVAAMGVIGVVFIAIMMGPAITLLWLVLFGCAWAFGLFLCVVAALLTISPQMRRAGIAFLVASAAANVVLGIGAVIVAVAATLIANS